jgi:hypothetical protein
MSSKYLASLALLLFGSTVPAAAMTMYLEPGGFVFAGVAQKVVLIDRANTSPPGRIRAVEKVGGEILIAIERPSQTVPVSAYDFTMTADLPPLAAGSYEVKVYDGSTPPQFPIARFQIGVAPSSFEMAYAGPAAPTPDDEIKLRLSQGPCGQQSLYVERTDFDIRLWAPADCWQYEPEGYELSLGKLAAGKWYVEADTAEFPIGNLQLEIAAPPSEAPGNVLAGEFEVTVEWRTALGETGEGKLVQPPSEDSALYYFFSPANWELMVKVLNGCAINGHYWVFGAASTDVGYTVDIRRRNSSQTFRADNPIGTAAPAITDITAFPCDPDAP